jgi:hypothetical protein
VNPDGFYSDSDSDSDSFDERAARTRHAFYSSEVRVWLGVMILSGCTSGAVDPQPQSAGIAADVHVHQFGVGSHVSAGFSTRAVPFHPELDEQLAEFVDRPARTDGPCALYVSHRCDPICDGTHQYCSGANVCSEYAPIPFVDGGPVVVAGSSLAPKITVTWDPKGFYRSDRSPLLPVFAGGESLVVDASGPFAFDAEATAPHDPQILAPTAGFHLGAQGLHVAWTGQEARIAVRIAASTKSGDYGSIVCLDDDHGALDLPSSLVAGLPPPPRDLHLEVERFDRRLVPLACAGEQASIYVAWTEFVEGTD